MDDDSVKTNKKSSRCGRRYRKKNKYNRFAMNDLSRRVRSNVTKEKGMSNQTVARFCRSLCGDDFKGVYSADYIPTRLAARGRFIIVINLGVRRGRRGPLPMGHFVTVSADPSKVFYIDSYGLPNVEPHVTRFLQRCRRPVEFNLRPIQDLNSVYCGLFATLFAVYLDKQPDFKLIFKKQNLRENDKLCVRYLRRLIG